MASLSRDDILALRIAGLRDFYTFVTIFGGPPINQGGDISPIVHRPLCEFAADTSIKRKGIAMGRNLRKTTVFNRWKAIWLYLKDHEVRVMIGAETKDIADKTLIWIKTMIEANQLLRTCYPILTECDRAYSYRHRFSNTEIEMPRDGVYAEPTFFSIGCGTAAQSRHFTHLLLTDIVGERAKLSDLVMQTAMSWIDNLPELLVEPNPNSPTGSEIQLDFTHWKTGDAYQYMQDKYPEYQWRIVPALRVDEETEAKIKRGKSNVGIIQNPFQPIMETNYPDIVKPETGEQIFPTETYLEMMGSPDRSGVFWTQHMNAPGMADSSGNDFRYEWLRWYTRATNELGENLVVCEDAAPGKEPEKFRLRDMAIYGVIDPGGFSERTLKGSRCAALIVGQPRRMPPSAKKFVLWAWAKRVITPAQLMEAIFEANEKFRPRAWRIEVFSQAGYIMRDIREESERRGKSLAVVALPKDVGADAKDIRIRSLIAPLSNGEFYFHHSDTSLTSEITSYPGITNDMVDCLAWWNQMYGTGLTKRRTEDVNKRRYEGYLVDKGVWDRRP